MKITSPSTAAEKPRACCTALHVRGTLRHVCDARFWEQVAPITAPTLRRVK